MKRQRSPSGSDRVGSPIVTFRLPLNAGFPVGLPSLGGNHPNGRSGRKRGARFDSTWASSGLSVDSRKGIVPNPAAGHAHGNSRAMPATRTGGAEC